MQSDVHVGVLHCCLVIFAVAVSAKSARAQLEARIEISQVDYAGREIDLTGDEHTIDWIKWGFPGVQLSEDRTLGVSALDPAEQRLAHTRRSQTRAIYNFFPIVPEIRGDAPSEFFEYSRGTPADMWFSWRDGDPRPSSVGIIVRGGLKLRQRALDGVYGYGVIFDVDATISLRDLQLYLDCPDQRSNGAMIAITMHAADEMREYEPQPLCDHTEQHGMLVHIKFSARPEDIEPRLSVALTSTGISDNAEDPAITLGAAVLVDAAAKEIELPLSPLSCSLTRPARRGRHVCEHAGLIALALFARSRGARTRRLKPNLDG